MTTQLEISKLQTEIEEKEKDLAALKVKLANEKKESLDKELAKTLHSLLCVWNHTDGCGWYYEVSKDVHNWNGNTHSTYLKKAQKLICACDEKGIDTETVIQSFQLIKGL